MIRGAALRFHAEAPLMAPADPRIRCHAPRKRGIQPFRAKTGSPAFAGDDSELVVRVGAQLILILSSFTSRSYFVESARASAPSSAGVPPTPSIEPRRKLSFIAGSVTAFC